MTKSNTRRGFTLIELLVVVLIIGILAAVAVPQYQVAVEKSRAAEALVILKNAQQARVLDFLEHGAENPSNPPDIMEFSSGEWSENGALYCTSNFVYVLDDCGVVDASRINKNNTSCDEINYDNYSYYIQLGTPFGNSSNTCFAADDVGYKICKSLASQGFEIDDQREQE